MNRFFPRLLRIKNASLVTFAATVLWLTPRANAIVDANSQSNTSAPSDGVPWDSVGVVNGAASGTYLGAGWVLTAAHVGAATTRFLGQSFLWDGTIYPLTNSDGTYADGVLYHLTSMPALPRMPLVTSTPSTLSAVDMIGFGYISGSTQMDFSLGASGFYWSALPTKGWGNNMVSGGATSVFDGTTNLVAFPTTFDAAPLQTSDECQAAPGDSGGGVFYKNGSTWELAGMIVAIGGPESNRPYNTAVYTDETFSLDIATYRNQIMATIQRTVPTLSIARVGDNMKISWPDTGVAYSLQATATFSPANWAVITPSETVTNGQIVATVPITTSTRFFRLKR